MNAKETVTSKAFLKAFGLMLLGAAVGVGGVYFYLKATGKEAYGLQYRGGEYREQHKEGECPAAGGMHGNEQRGPQAGNQPAGEDHDMGNQDAPGRLIRELLSKRETIKFKYYEYDNELYIKWEITAPKEVLDTLYDHIKQMKDMLLSGRTPRKWDPAFVAEGKTAKYVKTELNRTSDTTLEVIKKAENKCAYEIIKYHAQIVQGFITKGEEEVRATHPVSDEVVELCKSEGVDLGL